MAETRWVVVATRTHVWETAAASAEEALEQIQGIITPEEPPDEDPDDYGYTVHAMEGRVVYPHQVQPAFLAKHDERTAELRRVRELLERLGDLAGLPTRPEVTALIDEITEFPRQRRAGED